MHKDKSKCFAFCHNLHFLIRSVSVLMTPKEPKYTNKSKIRRSSQKSELEHKILCIRGGPNFCILSKFGHFIIRSVSVPMDPREPKNTNKSEIRRLLQKRKFAP